MERTFLPFVPAEIMSALYRRPVWLPDYEILDGSLVVSAQENYLF